MPSLLRRADEIRDHGAAGLDDAALKTTALMRGASALARVILPAPGNPMIRILRFTLAPQAGSR
jgi:hypothetical protein